MSAHRTLRALMAGGLSAAVIGILLVSPPASAGPGDPATSDSAVTVSGKAGGPFADLKVTVSQTRNLINQVVTVTWTGGIPTLPGFGGFGVDFLQIMQCWGEDQNNGPDRTQCQFGAFPSGGNSRGGWVGSRDVTYQATLVDPRETLKPPGGVGSAYVPFWAAGHPQPTGPATQDANDFFDSQVSNEIPAASTHADGTGKEFFEVETVRQAAGLGCGDPVLAPGGSPKGRSCWLVIVPRGTTEVNGSTRTGANNNRLDSSPLSQTNWDDRLVVPLDFQPVGQACPIGAPERRLIGHELAADAVISWQPALCAGGGALFSYTQLPDDVARDQVLDGSTPGLSLVTNPIPPEAAPAEHPLVYAPVTLSGLTIAFNIEQQPRSDALPADKDRAGQRFPSLQLTPRLVAKLLTQSYRQGVQVAPVSMRNNPLSLTADPEFLALNPEYQGFTNPNQSPTDALVQLNGADVTSLLWSWVQADPDASKFLAGTPDENGMVINPANQGITPRTSTFPRNDQSCRSTADNNGITLTNCTLDLHPFTKDMHDAGVSASRGDSQARTAVLVNNTVTSTKVARQAPGTRALLAVVDTATAARYGLPTAALRNAAGKFVTPTTASLLAGEVAMKPSGVAGVLVSDPVATDPVAYPLAALSYAIISPSTLDSAAGKDYAAFLRYAAGPGQQSGLEPGHLPPGMVPLPDTLKAQTAAAAATVEAPAGKTTDTTPAPPPPTNAINAVPEAAGPASLPPDPGMASAPAATPTSQDATPTNPGGGPNSRSTLGAPQRAVTTTPTTPGVAQQPVARVRRTPSLPGPAWLGTVLVIILTSCMLAAMSPPTMHLLRTSPPVRYLLGAVAQRATRRGVTPTER